MPAPAAEAGILPSPAAEAGWKPAPQDEEPGEGEEHGQEQEEDDGEGDGWSASIDEYSRDDIVVAVRRVLSSGSWDRDEAIRAVAQALGFQRVGHRIREEIEGALLAAAHRGVVETVDGLLYPCWRTIEDYDRDFLKKILLSVMGNTWWDQDDAIRAAAYHLGFARTGHRICDAFKSAINGLIRQGQLERAGSSLRRR